MRLIKVKAPRGKGAQVAEVAFQSGIDKALVHQEHELRDDGSKSDMDVVDVEASTPVAKAYVEALLSQPFYDREKYSVTLRQPLAIVSSRSFSRVTLPIWQPSCDVSQELWQFSHITPSFVLRVLVASLILSYGMIRGHLLLMVGGLLFLPLLPLILGMTFGSWTHDWRLAAKALGAFLAATALLVAGGALSAMVAESPLEFDQFSPAWAGLLLSLIVGSAAAIATADDIGRRELIGLAAASQIALIPAWLGICLVYGFDDNPVEKLRSFGVNVAAIMVSSLVTYVAIRMRGDWLDQVNRARSRVPGVSKSV